MPIFTKLKKTKMSFGPQKVEKKIKKTQKDTKAFAVRRSDFPFRHKRKKKQFES